MRNFKNQLFPYLLLLPLLTLVIFFRYYPAGKAFYYSVTNWKGYGEATFVGLDNFKTLFQDRAFTASLTNMLHYTLIRGSLLVVMPFIGAKLVNTIKNGFLRKFLKMAFIIPMIVPRSVIYMIWRFIYNPIDGLLNQLLALFRLDSLQHIWLGNTETALAALAFIGFPLVSGLGFILYLTSLEAIPQEVNEALTLDGCPPLRKIFSIDLHFVSGALMTVGILAILEGVNVAEPQLALTTGGPVVSTQSLGYLLYHNAFLNNQFGVASAAGIVMFLLGLTFSLILIRLKYGGRER